MDKRGRQEFERREAEWLAPYGMPSRGSRGRRFAEPPDAWRTDFQRDRDRIVHSTAFRRLENKTQVFVSGKGDHYRTRLTHSLEVAQISRSLARNLGLNEDLSEAVALAHDLGHAPFGHSGGDVLARLMQDHGGFEHNRQSLRIVESLEIRYPEWRGLNLTFEVRESIIKHNRPFDGPAHAEYDPGRGPLLEAELVDACDGIAYNSHDLDDGLVSGILDQERVDELSIMKVVGAKVARRWPGIDGPMRRKKCVSELIDHLLHDLAEASLDAMRRRGIEDLEDVRAQTEPVLGFSPEVREQEEELRAFLYDEFYTHYEVHRMRNRAKVFIEGLFREFVANPRLLPPKWQLRMDEDGLHRTVADYIAGMTDSYAQSEYRKLFDPFET